jgi:putative tricarboxylic transport membrane protein
MLEAIATGLLALLTPQALLFMLIGSVYGLIIGILPGLGGIIAMTLLLPFTFGYELGATLALLLGAHIGTIWGGSVTSILFNVPGQAKSLPLIFDGYPMTLKGEAERALGASAMATLLGGVIGAIFLALCIPIVRPLILALGPAEYLMMALWGMTLIATFSDGSLLKGLIAACVGVLIAFIGMDPVTATPRYTFGSIFLLDGVSFAVAMIGVFAVAEMMKLYLKGGALVSRQPGAGVSTVVDGIKDTFRHWGLVVRSSILGLWIGVLPGIGASTGGIAAYAQAMQTSRHPETFGTGNVEGVIAPDATVGANEGGGLLPTLAFGIPGGESMALLLIAFINMGIAPGPQMLSEDLDVVFMLVWIVIIASVVTSGIGLVISPWLARMPTLKGNLVIPIVLCVCFLGAYATRGRLADVTVAAIFGVLGYFMDKYRFSRANLVIGMVLATMIERSLHVSLTLYGPDFLLERPIALVMFVLIVLTTAWPFVRSRRRARAGPAVEGGKP